MSDRELTATLTNLAPLSTKPEGKELMILLWDTDKRGYNKKTLTDLYEYSNNLAGIKQEITMLNSIGHAKWAELRKLLKQISSYAADQKFNFKKIFSGEDKFNIGTIRFSTFKTILATQAKVQLREGEEIRMFLKRYANNEEEATNYI
jgi:hypothetical protein